MALVKVNRFYENLSVLMSEKIFNGDGIILGVNARWIGYTKSESERSYVLGGLHIGFADDDAVRPLGEDDTNKIIVPFGNAFYFVNPFQGTILGLVTFSGEPIIKLHKPTNRVFGQFNGGLTFQAISDDTANPHSVTLDIEAYLYDA